MYCHDVKSNPLRLILLHFKNCHGADTAFYTDSARVADATDLSTNVVGARLRYIARADGVPIDCSPWSRTAGNITYYVEMPARHEVTQYLEEVRRSEPSMVVGD